MIVIIEIAVIPLIFHLYFTAVIFTLFNAILLSIELKKKIRL